MCPVPGQEPGEAGDLRVQGPQAPGHGFPLILTGPAAAGLLAALHAGCFREGARWDEAAMAALLGMPGCFAVADLDGLALARVAADEAELLTLGVLPQARRRGAGSALLRAASGEAVRLGATRLFLEVAEGNAPARALYAQAGLVEVGRRRRYYPDGDDALVLAMPLSAA